jgi:hypothetical protein
MNAFQLLRRAECLLWERGTALLACKTRVAELLHLFEWGEATDKLLLFHPPEDGEACAVEARMPPPRIFPGPRAQDTPAVQGWR